MADAGRPALVPKDWNDPATKALVRCSTIRAIRMPHSGPRARPRRRAAQRGRRRRRLRGSGLSKNHVWALAIDSAQPDRASDILDADRYDLAGRSAAILVEQPSCEARRQAPGIADHILDALATAAGIAPHWFDVNGNRHKVPADTKRALLTALGLPASSAGEARASLASLARERELRSLPVATTLRQAGAMTIRLGGHLAGFARRIGLTITLEDGSTRRVEIAADDGQRSEAVAADRRRAAVRDVTLPALPFGGIAFGRRKRQSALHISPLFPMWRFCRKRCVDT